MTLLFKYGDSVVEPHFNQPLYSILIPCLIFQILTVNVSHMINKYLSTSNAIGISRTRAMEGLEKMHKEETMHKN